MLKSTNVQALLYERKILLLKTVSMLCLDCYVYDKFYLI